MNGTILTLGVYGYDADAFERAILDAKPDIVVDIRRRRGVRGARYSFANSTRLQNMLAKNAIPYIHRIDLATPEAVMKREGEIDRAEHIARHERDHLSDDFISDYTESVLKHFIATEFIEGVTVRAALAEFIASLGDDISRVVLLCVERTANACHRGLLAAEIVHQLGWDRVDLEA